MQRPKTEAQNRLPVWQSVLLTHGCHVDNGTQIVPLKLEPLGNLLRCTPSFNGSMLPFDLPVRVGHMVTISWDSNLSRYIVESRGQRMAA
jgi:hypothetical protein